MPLNKFDSLDSLLDASAMENLCTTMFCSTCGAGPLRQRTADFVANQMEETRWKTSGNSGQHELAIRHADRLLDELRSVTEGSIQRDRADLRKHRMAVLRFILHDIWLSLGREVAEDRMQDRLSGTFVGQVLAKMIAYESDLRRRRAIHEAAHNPVEVERRRAEKRLAKADAKALI